ncbi:MAG: hypothetical protein ACR2JB_28460 [Bryobacteraceae bacterium]
MSRQLAALLVAMVLAGACGSNIKSKEKVQQAILTRLETNSGLDLKKLDVTTTGVSFDKNMAYATVAFHQKGDSNLGSGMVMTYTLENRGGKWAVVKVGDSHGRSMTGKGPHGAGELPAGHPPVDSVNPPALANPRGGTQER